MYSAALYTTQDCSLVEYSPVINNPTTSSLFPSAYQIKYELLSLFFFYIPQAFCLASTQDQTH